MNEILEKIIAKTPICSFLNNRQVRKQIARWERKGRLGAPPHAIKQQALEFYSKKFGLKILVETGTFYGDMIEAMKNNFDRLYSIELSEDLYEKAKKRFTNDQHIELILGDSGAELGNLMPRIDHPSLFWLDGHYSAGETAQGEKDTPIFEELEHILNAENKRHVIIIDDARCFGTESGYPTIGNLSSFILSKRPEVEIVIQDDSIRITPRF